MAAALTSIATAATDTAAIALAVFGLVLGIKVFKWAKSAL